MKRSPNLSEKLAAALLKIRIGDEWLINDERLRDAGTAKDIIAYCEFDHRRRYAEGGSTAPQNIDPMRKADHREKSRKDTTEVAKGKRFGKKHAEFLQRVRVKIGQAVSDREDVKPKRKSKIPSRPFPTREERKRAKEWKEANAK